MDDLPSPSSLTLERSLFMKKRKKKKTTTQNPVEDKRNASDEKN